MPIYENRQNAENIISLPKNLTEKVIFGTNDTIDFIVGTLVKSNKHSVISFDGWYGINWDAIVDAITEKAKSAGLQIVAVNFANAFKSPDELDAYKSEFLTDDPAFGKVNSKGSLIDILSNSAIAEIKQQVEDVLKISEDSVVLIYGCGSQTEALKNLYNLKFYFDKTADPMLWDMWTGELIPFGFNQPKKDYGWKEYYYCDFYLLNKQKNEVLPEADYYVEAIHAEELKILPVSVLEAMVSELSKQPIKQIKTYSPGPWGAYRFKDLWDIPGLAINAWNRLAGADLSILVQVERGKVINMPTTNLLMYKGAEVVGDYVNTNMPGLIPLEVWLDDGYFPEPQPAERTSMPIHNHPGTQYVKDHFNEPIGRYETYYIIEAYQGANTWMGFKEDCDLELWETKIRESWESKKPIADWKEFIANWSTNVGDLFLIPPGTTHCHGGNQMVLEMDTCPSVAGCEYSFFGYDFMRPTWDDAKKTMTAKPMSMHLEHYIDNEKWCREKWVEENLRAKPEVVKWTKEYSMDRYSTYGPLPFEIERIHFEKFGENQTNNKSIHAITLSVGKRIMIRSKKNPNYCTEIDKFQTALVPASLDEYELINLHEGVCTVVIWRLKVN
jgi:hypothetical protein